MRIFKMYDVQMQQSDDDLVRHGVKQLQTPQEVTTVLDNPAGTVLVFVDSDCGCAGGIARPALRHALNHQSKPDVVVSVFASADREATAQARKYFTNQPPSSPSFALIRNGKLVEMIHRLDIRSSTPEDVATLLTSLFDKHCS